MKRLAAGGLVLVALTLPTKAALAQQCDTSSCGATSPAVQNGNDTVAAGELLTLVNTVRAQSGLPALENRSDIADVAAGHSQAMGQAGEIFHNDAYFTSAMKTRLGITSAGENVGTSGSIAGVHKALMDSDLHRGNILSPTFRVAGIGVYRQGASVYVSQNFGVPRAGTAARSAPAPRPAPTTAPAAPKPAAKPAPVAKPKPAAAPVAAPPAPTTTTTEAVLPAITAPPTPDPATPPELAIATPVPTSPASATKPAAAAPAVLLLAAVSVFAMARIRRHVLRST